MWRNILIAVFLTLFVAGCGPEPPVDGPTTTRENEEGNKPPVIDDIAFVNDGSDVVIGEEQSIMVTASDPENDGLHYTYEATRGSVDPEGLTSESKTTYTAPDEPGPDVVTVVVEDEHGNSKPGSISIDVVPQSSLSAGAEEADEEPDAGLVVKITSPTDGSEQASTYVVEGTAKSVPDSSNLWLVVEVENLFYPQGRLLVVDGSWDLEVQMGSKSADVGQEFDLLVLDASDSLSVEYQDWLDNSADYAGLPIPEDALGLDKVSVILSEFP